MSSQDGQANNTRRVRGPEEIAVAARRSALRRNDPPAVAVAVDLHDTDSGGGAQGISLIDDEDDDDPHVEEQMFLETLRRGTVAVEQRRRRLLDRPRDSLNDATARLPQRINHGSAEAMADGRPLVRESTFERRLQAALDGRADPLAGRTQGHHRVRQPSIFFDGESSLPTATTSNSTRRPFIPFGSFTRPAEPVMLLYCQGSLLDGSCGDAKDRATYLSKSRGPISQVLGSSENPAHSKLQGGGGCGQLICARGRARAVGDGSIYSSDAPPLSQAVDWLELVGDTSGHIGSGAGVPGGDDEQEEFDRWPRGCRCLKATLGCRNCGNAVGHARIFECEQCCISARRQAQWTIWSTAAVPRKRKEQPLSHWDDISVGMGEAVASTSNQTSAEDTMVWDKASLPSIKEDAANNLSGLSEEWLNSGQAFLEGQGIYAPIILDRNRPYSTRVMPAQPMPEYRDLSAPPTARWRPSAGSSYSSGVSSTVVDGNWEWDRSLVPARRRRAGQAADATSQRSGLMAGNNNNDRYDEEGGGRPLRRIRTALLRPGPQYQQQEQAFPDSEAMHGYALGEQSRAQLDNQGFTRNSEEAIRPFRLATDRTLAAGEESIDQDDDNENADYGTRNYASEREFVRQRTAEVLESGGGGAARGSGRPTTVPGLSNEQLVTIHRAFNRHWRDSPEQEQDQDQAGGGESSAVELAQSTRMSWLAEQRRRSIVDAAAPRIRASIKRMSEPVGR